MAKLLTLDIIEGYVRPVVLLKNDITCLIDTGANIPVWTRGADRLREIYNAENVAGKKFILSGFGKYPEEADAYWIKDFVLMGETDDKITFKSLMIACTKRPSMVANLILPATAFTHMNYTIRNVGVDNPMVEIEHERDEYSISPIYSSVYPEVIEKVYSFSNK